jgi:hypothetical protein
MKLGNPIPSGNIKLPPVTSHRLTKYKLLKYI